MVRAERLDARIDPADQMAAITGRTVDAMTACREPVGAAVRAAMAVSDGAPYTVGLQSGSDRWTRGYKSSRVGPRTLRHIDHRSTFAVTWQRSLTGTPIVSMRFENE